MVSYADVLKLAEQLPEAGQNQLIYQLRASQVAHKVHNYRSPTREELIDELNNLLTSGVFDKVEGLYGKYANPNVPEMSAEDFHAELHAIATEWEQELDEFDTDED